MSVLIEIWFLRIKAFLRIKGNFNFTLWKPNRVQSQSQRCYHGNYAIFLLDRSHLRSFASGKTNEVFYVPFYARIGDRANEPSGALNETTYAHPLDRNKKEVLSINRNTSRRSCQFRRIIARSKLKFAFYFLPQYLKQRSNVVNTFP